MRGLALWRVTQGEDTARIDLFDDSFQLADLSASVKCFGASHQVGVGAASSPKTCPRVSCLLPSSPFPNSCNTMLKLLLFLASSFTAFFAALSSDYICCLSIANSTW